MRLLGSLRGPSGFGIELIDGELFRLDAAERRELLPFFSPWSFEVGTCKIEGFGWLQTYRAEGTCAGKCLAARQDYPFARP